MKLTVILLALGLAACGGNSAAGTGANPATTAKPAAAKPGAAKPAANTPAGNPADAAQQALEGITIPTQDEADEQAAAAITEANADAEFEKLQKELAGEKP